MRTQWILNVAAPPAWSPRAARVTLVALCVTVTAMLLVANVLHFTLGGTITFLAAIDSDSVSWAHLVIASTLLSITGFAISQAPEILVERLVLPISSAITLSTVITGHFAGEFGLAPHVLLYMPLIASAYTLRPRYVVQAALVTLASAGVLAALNAQSYDDWSDDAVSFGVSAIYLAFTLSFIRAKQIQASDRALFIATHDPLTRLLNRRQFELLPPMRLGPSAQTPGCLLVVDLDHFSIVNDQYGHTVGDAVLQAVADVVADAIPDQAKAYRLGGDEFAVDLPEVSLEEAEKTASDIVTRTAQVAVPTGDGETAVTSTCSVGVAHWPTHAEGHPNLYAAADAALYRAKEQGRGCFATPERATAPTPLHTYGLSI